MDTTRSTLSAIAERKVSRRSALKIIGGTTIATVAAACSPSANSSSTPSASASGTSSPVAPLPSPSTEGNAISGTINGDLLPTLPRGGHISVSMQNPGSLNPLTDTAVAVREAVGPVHDTLEAFDHQRRLRPSLAKALEIVDEKTLRYTLHEGITFHDGRPVTSSSIKDLVEWVKNPDNGSWVGGPFQGVTVETPDDQTVVLKLDTPNAGIRRSLVDLPIVPVDSIATQGSKPMGCGPFLFEEYVRDSHIAYGANPNYRNPDAPRLDTLRHRHYADENSGLQAFLAGESDFTLVWLSGMVPEFKSREQAGELKTYVGNQGFSYLAFNLQKKPYDDPRVRKAIRLAIDRAPLADIPFGGLASPWPIPMSPEFPYYPQELEQELLVRDLEQSKQLLSEAGIEPGFSEKLLVNNLGYPESQGTIVQSQLAEVGIKIDLEVMDVPTLLDRRGSGDFGMLLLGNLNDPEPTAYLSRHFRTGATWAKAYGYSNAECDRLLDAAAQSFDDAERKGLYRDALRIALVEDTAMVSFCPEAVLYAYKPWTNGEQYGLPQNWKPEVIARLS